MNTVNCNYWKNGNCIAGVLRNPSSDFCNNICKANTSREFPWTIDGFHHGVIKNKKTSLIRKIYAYLKAESSLLFEGEVSKRIFKQRMKTCRTCEHLVKSDDEVGHCGACGCGMNSRASLTVKGRMPRAICVKGKWKK